MSLLQALPQCAPEVFSEVSLHVLSPVFLTSVNLGHSATHSGSWTLVLADVGARCLLLGERQFRSIQIRIRDRIGIKKAHPDLRTEAPNVGAC